MRQALLTVSLIIHRLGILLSILAFVVALVVGADVLGKRSDNTTRVIGTIVGSGLAPLVVSSGLVWILTGRNAFKLKKSDDALHRP
jgi:hypothetical protein